MEKKIKTKKLPNKLPKFLYQYFWDIEASKLNPSNYSFYVVNRLLNRGDLKAIKWVLNNFPRELIKQTVKKSRDWSKISINFWAGYFGLKRNEVICLNKFYLQKQKTFWPY